MLSALAVSACSNGGEAAPTTTLAPVTIPDPTTSTTSTTSTTATTTATSTEPVVVTTSTAIAPTTTTITEAAAKQAVVAAAIASWEAFNELMLDPTNDDKLAAVAQTSTGVALDNALMIIAERRLANERSITNPDTPSAVQVDPDSVSIDSAKGQASVVYCRIGSNITVETAGNPDGSDRVVDATITSYLERTDLVLVNGVWLENDGVILQQFEGATQCQGFD